MLPQLGIVLFEDAESGRLRAFDTSSRGASRAYARRQADRKLARDSDFKRYGVSPIEVRTDSTDYAGPLVNYFRIRAKRR